MYDLSPDPTLLLASPSPLLAARPLGPLAHILLHVAELRFFGFLVSCYVLNVTHGWLQFWSKYPPPVMHTLPVQETL